MSRSFFDARVSIAGACSLLLGASLAGPLHAQHTAAREVAPALDAELLVAHPGLVGGDMESMRADVLAALEADPTGELALEAVLRLTQLDALGETDYLAEERTERLRALEARVEDAEVSLWLRRIVAGDATRRRFSANPVDLSGDLYEEFISRWRIVGPLGDLTGPLGTAPAPEDSPEPTGEGDPRERLKESYLAVDGEPVEWVAKDRNRNSLYITPIDELHPDVGLAYALAYVRSDADEPREVLLEVRSQGRVRAYWNGVRAIDEPRIDPFAVQERHLARVTLVPGVNALLLRVALGSANAFAARVLDAEGRVLPLAEVGPEEGVLHDFAVGGETEALETPLLAREPGTGPFGPALDALRAIMANRYDIALTVPAPEGGDARALNAWKHERFRALAGAGHLPDEIKTRRLRSMIEEFRGEGPFFAVARQHEINLLRGDDRPLEALEAVDEWIAAAPERAWPRHAKTFVLDDIDVQGVLGRLHAEGVLRAFPSHTGARMYLADALSREDDLAGAANLAWDVLRADGESEAAFELLIDVLSGTEDPRIGVMQVRAEEWLELHPGDDGSESLFERLLALGGNEQRLLDIAERTAEEAPGEPSTWWTLGSRRLNVGDVPGALAAFERELALEPADETTRRVVARLGGQDPAESFFTAFAPDERAALEVAEGVLDASVVEALDSGLVYYFPDGSSHARYHTLTVPRDRQGTEALLRVPATEGTKVVRVLTTDGRVLEPVLTEGEWVLPSLEVGDVVETVWDSRLAGDAGEIPAPSSWRFASFERAFPTSRWVVFIPDELKNGRLAVVHFEGRRESIEWGGGTVHVFEASNPRQTPEPYQPSYPEILPTAGYFVDRELDGEARRWDEVLTEAMAIPRDVEEEIAGFSREHGQAPDTLERAKHLYEALDERLQSYEGAGGAAQAWMTKRGQPLPLLGALYERAGVPFEWAVIERPVAPELDPEPVTLFVNMRGLSQPLMRLPAVAEGEDPVWIMPGSAPGVPFGALSESMAGANVYVIDAAGDVRVESLPTDFVEGAWNADVSLEYALDPDGSARVSGSYVDRSPRGEMLIEQIRQATAEQRDGYALQQASSLAPGVDIDDAGVVLDGSRGPGVVVEFDGTLPGFAAKRGGRYVATVPFLPLQLAERFGPAQREWPLALRESIRLRVEVTVELGGAWKLEGGPEEISEDRIGFEATLRVDESPDDAVVYTQRYIQRGAVIAAADVPGFLSRLAEIESEFERAMVLERVEDR